MARELDTRPRDESKWQKDESGKLVMPELQSEFLDWLLADERIPDTEAEWCRAHSLGRDTVRKWRSDRRFKEVWERRSIEKHVSPDRLHKVLEVLYRSATATGDVAAAKQYLLYTEKLLPPREIQRDASVAHMTDVELRSELEGILAAGFGG